MGWITGIGDALGGIFKGVKSLVTTDKDRLEAVERMQVLGDKFGEKELDYKIELAKSGNSFTKSVRPMIAYTFLGLYINSKAKDDFRFSEADYELFLYIVLFYFGLRSSEKLVSVFKGIKK